jgi:hypothetical protein
MKNPRRREKILQLRIRYVGLQSINVRLSCKSPLDSADTCVQLHPNFQSIHIIAVLVAHHHSVGSGGPSYDVTSYLPDSPIARFLEFMEASCESIIDHVRLHDLFASNLVRDVKIWTEGADIISDFTSPSIYWKPAPWYQIFISEQSRFPFPRLPFWTPKCPVGPSRDLQATLRFS